jgi:hypothetical protein
MARKKERISLMDLKRTDEVEEKMDTSISNPIPPVNTTTPSSTNSLSKNAKPSQSSTGEYEKLSVSIPLDTFETLQDISRERRRVKQKHTMSQMVREALELWLEHRNQTNSI